jgi:hypothetical protein
MRAGRWSTCFLPVSCSRSLKLVPVLGLFAALIFVASPARHWKSRTRTTTRMLTPAEPDYRLINLPTTLRLPL